MANSVNVGIITAAYNCGKYFSEYVDGLVKNQTFLPYKIAYVDDCSTDDSWQVVLDFFNIKTPTDKFSIKVNGVEFIGIRQPVNKGQATCRNIAIKYLQDCSILGICDSDDKFLPNKVAKSVEVILKYPFVSLVYSDYTMVYSDEKPNKREYKPSFIFDKLISGCFISNNSFFPASALAKIGGGYDEDLSSAEDYLLWLKLSSCGMAYHIAESLYEYKLHGENTTVKTPQEKLAKNVNLCYKKFDEWRQNQGQQ